MNHSKVSIVVLNWNGGKHVLQCLQSLFQNTYPNYNVVIVDNASTDNSVELMESWAKEWNYSPAVLRNKENLGVSKGFNVGIRYALDILNSDYVVILDNEVLVASDFLEQLINVANKEPSAGIFGSKIYMGGTLEVWAEGGLINYWTGRTPQRGAKLHAMAEGKEYVEVDWVATCCAMVSRRMCQTVGLLDETFTFGFEELEFSIRATRHGFKVLYVPTSNVWHDQDRSPEHMQRRRRLYYTVTKGQFMLMQKYWSKPQFLTATLYYFAYNLSYIFHFLIYSRDWDAIRLRLNGLRDFIKERKQYKHDENSFV